MNHFFAIKLPQQAQETVYQLAEEWRPLVMRSSWYDPEDYHLTLKFLGNLDEAAQPRLIEAARPIAESVQPLLVEAAPPGGFPSMRDPSVLWAGVSVNPDLDTLATRLDHAMASLGFRPERRRYQPHITVARCRLRTVYFDKNQEGLVPIDWPLPSERLFDNFMADRFVLLQTRSGEGRANRTGIRYNIVQTFPLAGAHSSDVS